MQMSDSWIAISHLNTINTELAETAEKNCPCLQENVLRVPCELGVERRHASGAGFFVVIAIGRHTSRPMAAR
jgi:hypothetical protein